ncbi:MAG: sigma-E factor negative regulatory protein [Proteobacteria bacterium]|nr:sigma-E factor negative regulatory protein [Pseudomonadota bacterium]
MNEKRIEKDMATKEMAGDRLSALIDDELASREQSMLLARLCRDPASRGKFGRYALIGNAMRAGKDDFLATGLAGNVSAELDGVAAHQGGPGIGNHRLIRPLLGFAVAAGVAALAIINLPGADLSRDSGSPGIAGTAGPSYTVPPDSASITRAPRVSARLASYLMDHSEFSPSPVRRNVLYEIIGREDATAVLNEHADSTAEPTDESSGQ